MYYQFFRVSLKDVKSFLPKISYKISTNKLREIFQEVDKKDRTEIGFDNFVILYQKLISENTVRRNEKLKSYFFLFQFCVNKNKWNCWIFYILECWLEQIECLLLQKRKNSQPRGISKLSYKRAARSYGKQRIRNIEIHSRIFARPAKRHSGAILYLFRIHRLPFFKTQWYLG